MRFNGFKSLCAVSLLATTIFSSPALSASISLQLNDGGFTITGELISFDGDHYVVESPTLGSMTVSVDKFRCIKGACPESTGAVPVGVNEGVLRITGSATIGYQLLPDLIRKYAEKKNVKIASLGEGPSEDIQLLNSGGGLFKTITLNREGSATAFDAIASGETDIGTSTQRITDAQVGDLARAGHLDMDTLGRQHILGLDGLVIMVSNQNRINALSMEDVSRIFAGEIRDWSELGFDAGPISVYVRNKGTGTYDTFQSLILKPFKRELTPQAVPYQSNQEVARAIASDAGGIGFAGFKEAEIAKPIGIKDTCGITHRPTPFRVKSGEYPLSRELYMYTTKINEPKVAEFVGFAVSPEGQQTLKEAGFVDRRIETALFDQFADRVTTSIAAPAENFDLALMRQLTIDLQDGQRLSSTIRFEESGNVLIDSESTQQLSPIVDYINNQDLRRYRVLLAGFSDSTGLFQGNLSVSQRRAEAVREALVKFSGGSINPDDILVKAYGELLPVACNDTDKGRSKNRRVEVWLVPRLGTPLVLNRQ